LVTQKNRDNHPPVQEENRMTVAQILAGKSPEVVTMPPHRSLQEATALLAERGIGAVIITGAAGDVVGIISERDIVRAIARDGGKVLHESLSRHMTGEVVTTELGESVDHVMETMTHGRFRHLPVIENRRLVGVVSIGDIVKFRLESMETEYRAMRDYIATA
jgi:CBS domain-containing protein